MNHRSQLKKILIFKNYSFFFPDRLSNLVLILLPCKKEGKKRGVGPHRELTGLGPDPWSDC